MMRVLSPAKINLHLRVGRPAEDGFHPLLTWMCTIGLRDTIEMELSNTPGIHLKCDRPNVPTDETNLIVRAGKALNPKLGADVTLQKKIPLGGGLGGGSSNAAFALIGLNRLWNLNLPIDQLAKIGSQLGSDVPFFLRGPSSICTGRGEHVIPTPHPTPKYIVLFFPKFPMSTPAVYKKFDEMNLGSEKAIIDHPDWQSWSKLSAIDLMQTLTNDLEPPAFALNPALADLRHQLETKIAQPVRMSGSGSTLFTLADNNSQAQQLLSRAQNIPLDSLITSTTPARS
jgi:4-diphosphocytidyl-2-C-methyl-D-erythritol kinase